MINYRLSSACGHRRISGRRFSFGWREIRLCMQARLRIRIRIMHISEAIISAEAKHLNAFLELHNYRNSSDHTYSASLL